MCNFANKKLKLSTPVYHSQSATNSHNKALAYLLDSYGRFYDDVAETVDVYTKQCSVLVNAVDLAIMSACLANNGVNPISGKVVFEKKKIPFVLSTMLSGGAYNYSGKGMTEIGIPIKTGVSGTIIGVVPGKYGIAVVSPPLDKNGNSVRGIAAFKHLSRELNLNMFQTKKECLCSKC